MVGTVGGGGGGMLCLSAAIWDVHLPGLLQVHPTTLSRLKQQVIYVGMRLSMAAGASVVLTVRPWMFNIGIAQIIISKIWHTWCSEWQVASRENKHDLLWWCMGEVKYQTCGTLQGVGFYCGGVIFKIHCEFILSLYFGWASSGMWNMWSDIWRMKLDMIIQSISAGS